MKHSYHELDDEDLQSIWQQHRKNLGILERQSANYGMSPPIDSVNNIAHTKDKLNALKEEFARRGLPTKSVDPHKNIGRQLYNLIPLEDEQRQLLTDLVEAQRGIPRLERMKFQLFGAMGMTSLCINHPAFDRPGKDVYGGDIEVLINEGLLSGQVDDMRGTFDITPRALAYVDYLKELQNGD